MPTTPFVLIEDGKTIAVDAVVDDSAVRLDAATALESLGWTQKPEGLCQGDVCIPISNQPELINDAGVDLEALGALLGRPIAIDRDASVASMGAATDSHGSQLASGEAPDFTLPDLSGTEHTLSTFRGKKVLLIAYASW